MAVYFLKIRMQRQLVNNVGNDNELSQHCTPFHSRDEHHSNYGRPVE